MNKNTICLWSDNDAEAAAYFYAATLERAIPPCVAIGQSKTAINTQKWVLKTAGARVQIS